MSLVSCGDALGPLPIPFPCPSPNHSHPVAKGKHAKQPSAMLCAEFNKITTQTALGFIVMGFIGFFVKLIFIVR